VDGQLDACLDAVASLTSPRLLLPALENTLSTGERLIISTIVLYEWRRGPRLPHELTAQEKLFPAELAIVFGVPEALVAADVYRKLSRPRGPEVDIAIAAHAIARGFPLWALKHKNFADIPGLTLASIH